MKDAILFWFAKELVGLALFLAICLVAAVLVALDLYANFRRRERGKKQ